MRCDARSAARDEWAVETNAFSVDPVRGPTAAAQELEISCGPWAGDAEAGRGGFWRKRGSGVGLGIAGAQREAVLR
ncbi:hypothetical protein CCMA1212_009469 [Trichoderma ghanense]|uniref:Uncharacterized protein n=1 Tax=Trichoderma ghanense TaxID=65468 RepID=A0ABY2GRQ9_9HYPO